MNEAPVYRVEVDWAPVYELASSLGAFIGKTDHKAMDEPAWAERTRRLKPELAAELKECRHTPIPLDILIALCPGERDVDGFLDWVGGLAPGELYELLGPFIPEGVQVPPDLGEARDRLVRILRAWNEQYFRSVDPAILDRLAAEAEARRSELPPADPVGYVTRATRGVLVEPTPGLEVVRLVPQYHFRPFNIYGDYRGLTVFSYPADIKPLEPEAPPPGLLRAFRALGDESRLRILRFLRGGPMSFTDVVRSSHLAKSTIHHHMITLRAAGLVRVHHVPHSQTELYSLNPGALDLLRNGIAEFLEQ